ncbi:hypothetical protein PQX77_010313, partial [Marasmius sp. AFHP31]
MSFRSYPNCSDRYQTHGSKVPGSPHQRVTEDYNFFTTSTTASPLTLVGDVGQGVLLSGAPSNGLGDDLNAAYTPVVAGVTESVYSSQSFVCPQGLQQFLETTSGPGEWSTTTPTHSHQSYASIPVDNNQVPSHWPDPFKESQQLPRAAQVVVGPTSDKSQACGATLRGATLDRASNNL